jgi:hypothetical protein
MSISESHSSRQGRRRSTTRSSSPHYGEPMSRSNSQEHDGLGSPRSSSPDEVLPGSNSRSPSPQREASRSHSPTQPVVGQKRSRSRNEDGFHQLVKAQKVSEGSGRPKASDYDDVAKEVILCATAIYRCLVSTSNAFLTLSEEADLIKIAWSRANEETAQEIPMALTPGIAKVVSVLIYFLMFFFLALHYLLRSLLVEVKSGAR